MIDSTQEDVINWARGIEFFHEMKNMVMEKYKKKQLTRKQRDVLFDMIDEGRHQTFIENNPLCKGNESLKELAYRLL